MDGLVIWSVGDKELHIFVLNLSGSWSDIFNFHIAHFSSFKENCRRNSTYSISITILMENSRISNTNAINDKSI